MSPEKGLDDRELSLGREPGEPLLYECSIRPAAILLLWFGSNRERLRLNHSLLFTPFIFAAPCHVVTLLSPPYPTINLH